MIISEDVDGRMLRLIQQYYAAGYEMKYIPHVHTLVFKWWNATDYGGYEGKSVCQLGNWFTDKAQDYIIDLIYPRL